VKDVPCSQEAREVEQATRRLAETVHKVKLLESLQRPPNGEDRRRWQGEIAAAVKAREEASSALDEKAEALRACREAQQNHGAV
jgi:hypothetical protein